MKFYDSDSDDNKHDQDYDESFDINYFHQGEEHSTLFGQFAESNAGCDLKSPFTCDRFEC